MVVKMQAILKEGDIDPEHIRLTNKDGSFNMKIQATNEIKELILKGAEYVNIHKREGTWHIKGTAHGTF